MFARLGPWCHDRRRLVLVLWVVVLIGVQRSPAAIGDDYRQDFNLPGAESPDGFDILDDEFEGQGAGFTGTIVFQAEQGVDDPEVQAAMSALFDEVADLRRGRRGSRAPTTRAASSSISRGRRRSPTPTSSSPRTSTSPRSATSATPSEDDVPRSTACASSWAASSSPSSRSRPPRLLGLAFAIVILIVAFGSVLAMGLPVGVALFGIGIGGAGVDPVQPRHRRPRVRPVHRRS